MKSNRIEKLVLENHAEPQPYALLNHDQSIMMPKDNEYEYEYFVQVGCFPDTKFGKRSKCVFMVCIASILVVFALIAIFLLYNFFSCFAQLNVATSSDKPALL